MSAPSCDPGFSWGLVQAERRPLPRVGAKTTLPNFHIVRWRVGPMKTRSYDCQAKRP